MKSQMAFCQYCGRPQTMCVCGKPKAPSELAPSKSAGPVGSLCCDALVRRSVLRGAKTPQQLDAWLLKNRDVNSTHTYYLAGYADGVRHARRAAQTAENLRAKQYEEGVWE